MDVKQLKMISSIIPFLLGVIAFKDIVDYPFLFKNLSDHSLNTLIPQGIFVLGLLCVFVFYYIILRNIKTKDIFISQNEKVFRYFGFVIFFLGLFADILFNIITDERPSGSRMLALFGGTLVFVSYIFKIGIKMHEEQEFTA